MFGVAELSILAATPVLCVSLIGLILLCVKCREGDEKEQETDLIMAVAPVSPPPDLPLNLPPPPPPSENGNKAPVNEQPSLSRQSSLSSRASVRITITNIADTDHSPTLESPGSGISMADRELPKVPVEEEERIYMEECLDHDYDILDENRIPFRGPMRTPSADYDTIENLTSGYASIRDPGTPPPHPDYATIPRLDDDDTGGGGGYGGGGGMDNPYDTLPDILAQKHRRPSYEALPDMMVPRQKAATFSGMVRPLSEVYAVPIRPIDKHRARSERKPRENEDTVSVIYASVNLENRSSVTETTMEVGDDTAPPMPENPYAVLDSMLCDLNIPSQRDSRHYEDMAAARPASGISAISSTRRGSGISTTRPGSGISTSEDPDTPLNSMRRTMPVLAKSSPFAVTQTNSSPSVICDVEK